MTEAHLTPEQIRRLRPSFETTVRSARRVLIGTHLNPDGDAVGSALAMALWLDALGTPCEVVCHNPPPPYLEFMATSGRFRLQPEHDDHDVGVIVDLDALDRLGSTRRYFEGLPQLVLIDHHLPHHAPGDTRIVSVDAPATASILCDLIDVSEPGLTPEIATCLLTGIVTDTGSFRFPNTTAHSLHQAARLLEAGADLARIADEVYLNRDDAALRLLGEVLARVNTSEGGRIVWATVPRELFERTGASELHTEGIVNELLSMRSARIALLLREFKPGKVRGSLRSKGAIDVAGVAQSFGGGGHRNAAGVSFDGSLEDAESQIVEALAGCLASS